MACLVEVLVKVYESWTSRRSRTLRVKRDYPCCLKGLLTVIICKHVKKRVFKGWKEAFFVDMVDASACQVSYTLRILQLQRREAHHIKWLKYMRRHIKGKYLLFEATILEILVEV